MLMPITIGKGPTANPPIKGTTEGICPKRASGAERSFIHRIKGEIEKVRARNIK